MSLVVKGVVSLVVVVGVVRLIEVTTAAEGRVSDLQEFLVFEVASLFQPEIRNQMRNNHRHRGPLKWGEGGGGAERSEETTRKAHCSAADQACKAIF